MATDGRGIRAQADLDIQKFLQHANQLKAEAKQIGQSLQGIPAATPKLDAQKFTSDATTVRASVRGIVSELAGIPGLSGSLTGSFSKFSASGVAAAGAITAGIGVMTVAMVGATKAAVELEFEIAKVRSIKLDLDTSAASTSLRQISRDVGVTTTELAKSLYDIFSSVDTSQEQAVRLLDQFSRGAVAAQTDAKTFGTAVIGVLNAYKLDLSESTRISDIFFNTVKAGVVTGDELARGLGPLTASAKAAGTEFAELGALIVGVTKEGGDAAQNLNNLNNLFAKLLTKEATADFRALGIQVANSDGSIRSVIDIMKDLRAAMQDLTEVEKQQALQEIFPDLQARQAAQVIISQLDAVDKALATNRTNTNSTKEAYDVIAETSAQAFKRLQTSVTALAQDLGAVLLPAFTRVVGGAERVVLSMSDAGRAIDKFLAAPSTREAVRVLMSLTRGLPGSPESPAAPTGVDTGTGQIATPRGVPQGVPQLGTEVKPEDLERIRGMTSVTDDLNESLVENAKVTADSSYAEAVLGDAAAAVTAKLKEQYDVTNLIVKTQDLLTAGLAVGTGVTGEYAAALDKIIKNTKLSREEQEAQIAGLLTSQKATEELNHATELVDKNVGAHIVSLRQQATVAKDVEQATALTTQAMDLYREHLAAQTNTAEENSRTQAKLKADIDSINEGMAKAAQAGGAQYQERLNTLAAAIPDLTYAEAIRLKQMQLTGDQEGQLALISEKTGLSYQQLTAIVGQSTEEFKRSEAQVSALARGLNDFTSQEREARARAVFDTIVAGFNLADAARAKFEAATQGVTAALDNMAARGQASGAAIAQAMNAAGDAARAASAAIQAAATFQQTGRITPAGAEPPDALKIRNEAINVATETAATSQRSLDKAVGDFERANREMGRSLQERSEGINRAYSDVLDAGAKARREGDAQLSQDLAAAARTQNATLKGVAAEERSAARAHADALRDAGVNLELSLKNANKTYEDGLQALNEAAATAAQQATEQARDTMMSAGRALSQSMLQTLSAINNESVQREDLSLKALQGGTQAEQNAVATERVRQEATQGFAGAQRQLTEQQQRDKLTEDNTKALKDLASVMRDQAKAATALKTGLTDAQDDARTTFNNQANAAQRALAISQVGADRYFAGNQTNRRVVMINGRPQVVEEDVSRASPEQDVEVGGTAGARAAAARASREAQTEAFGKRAALEARLREQEAEAYAKWAKEREDFGRQVQEMMRKRQEDAVELRRQQREIDKQKEKAIDDANKEFSRALAQLALGLAALNKTLPEAIARRLNLQPNNLNFNKVINQETGTDFVATAARALMTRGAGGL